MCAAARWSEDVMDESMTLAEILERHAGLCGLSVVARVLEGLDEAQALQILLTPSPRGHSPLDLLLRGERGKAYVDAAWAAARLLGPIGEKGLPPIHPELDADLEADLRKEAEIDAVQPFWSKAEQGMPPQPDPDAAANAHYEALERRAGGNLS